MFIRYAVPIALLAIAVPSPLPAGLFGPPKFRIEQSDDRFSTDGLTTVSGTGNRISRKSLAGGVHIDSSGIFVEPVAFVRKQDRSVAALRLFIHNETSLESNGSTDVLNLGNPIRLSFVTGEGEPIGLLVHRSARDTHGPATYNQFSNSASIHVSESGFADVTPEQYQRIMNAPQLIARIEGDRRSMTYEAKDISPSFQVNLRSFWAEYLSKR